MDHYTRRPLITSLHTTLVTWIHGVEPEHFDPQDIEDCIQAVSRLIPADGFVHQLYNWSKLIDGRESQVYDIAKYRGNWLTRKVRSAICNIGLDMWYYLATKRRSEPGDWFFDIQSGVSDSLESLRGALAAYGYDVNIAFVAHSFGTKVALDWIIAHPDMRVALITLGSPLPLYGSSCFKDWGDPTLLPNLVSWTNISIQNDPISNLMRDNPNPAWKNRVKDFDLSTWDLLPMRAHTAYWSNKKVQKIIADALISH